MIYNIDTNTDDIIRTKMSDNTQNYSIMTLTSYDREDFMWTSIDFTLTVNAVNDAPVLLRPLEDLPALADSEAAIVVLSNMFIDRVY